VLDELASLAILAEADQGFYNRNVKSAKLKSEILAKTGICSAIPIIIRRQKLFLQIDDGKIFLKK